MRLRIKEAQLEFGYAKSGLRKKEPEVKPPLPVEQFPFIRWEISYEKLILSGIGMI